MARRPSDTLEEINQIRDRMYNQVLNEEDRKNRKELWDAVEMSDGAMLPEGCDANSLKEEVVDQLFHEYFLLESPDPGPAFRNLVKNGLRILIEVNDDPNAELISYDEITNKVTIHPYKNSLNNVHITNLNRNNSWYQITYKNLQEAPEYKEHGRLFKYYPFVGEYQSKNAQFYYHFHQWVTQTKKQEVARPTKSNSKPTVKQPNGKTSVTNSFDNDGEIVKTVETLTDSLMRHIKFSPTFQTSSFPGCAPDKLKAIVAGYFARYIATHPGADGNAFLSLTIIIDDKPPENRRGSQNTATLAADYDLYSHTLTLHPIEDVRAFLRLNSFNPSFGDEILRSPTGAALRKIQNKLGIIDAKILENGATRVVPQERGIFNRMPDPKLPKAELFTKLGWVIRLHDFYEVQYPHLTPQQRLDELFSKEVAEIGRFLGNDKQFSSQYTSNDEKIYVLLHCAAAYGGESAIERIVQILNVPQVDNSAVAEVFLDFNRSNYRHDKLLTVFVRENNLDLVKVALKHGAEVHERAIRYAIAGGNLDIFRLLHPHVTQEVLKNALRWEPEREGSSILASNLSAEMMEELRTLALEEDVVALIKAEATTPLREGSDFESEVEPKQEKVVSIAASGQNDDVMSAEAYQSTTEEMHQPHQRRLLSTDQPLTSDASKLSPFSWVERLLPLGMLARFVWQPFQGKSQPSQTRAQTQAVVMDPVPEFTPEDASATQAHATTDNLENLALVVANAPSNASFNPKPAMQCRSIHYHSDQNDSAGRVAGADAVVCSSTYDSRVGMMAFPKRAMRDATAVSSALGSAQPYTMPAHDIYDPSACEAVTFHGRASIRCEGKETTAIFSSSLKLPLDFAGALSLGTYAVCMLKKSWEDYTSSIIPIPEGFGDITNSVFPVTPKMINAQIDGAKLKLQTAKQELAQLPESDKTAWTWAWKENEDMLKSYQTTFARRSSKDNLSNLSEALTELTANIAQYQEERGQEIAPAKGNKLGSVPKPVLAHGVYVPGAPQFDQPELSGNLRKLMSKWL